ncbi:MAG: 50S ribosomal protein L17 [Candidatus Omnitrophota bacterium]
MRHRKKSERLSRPQAQKKALVKSLIRALVINERIITTTSRAKYLRGQIDKLITWAKKGTLSSKRLVYRLLEDHVLVKRLFDDIGPLFKGINGGYTRTLRVSNRKGDGASLSLIELTKIVKKEKVNKKKISGGKLKDTESVEIPTEEKQEKIPPKKVEKPKKGFVSGVRKIFKKERDAL